MTQRKTNASELESDPEILDLAQGLEEIGETPENALREARKMVVKDRRAKEREKARAYERRRREEERLARPPVDHEDAYWRHVNTCPHPQYSDERKVWVKENPWFDFKGKGWSRHTSPMLSNSGKTVMAWNPTYVAEDGEVVKGVHKEPNRRNDANRNWGLERD